MCGICGAIQVSGELRPPLAGDVLERMTDAMTHRGPDDRGMHVAPGIALGARRLSIIDVEGGHQPFANEDGTVWAVQNGELYNHADERRRLERAGHRFRSRCDTEVLPHLYEEHGSAFVKRLHGKFGLAAWDSRRRRAIVARDRLGVKPIYYALVGDDVLFASELKSLLASGLIPAELDLTAIDAYLTVGFVPGPRTPLAAVKKLLPGQQVVVEDGKVNIVSYWSFPEPDPQPLPPGGIDELAGELLALVEEAVRLRLMSDVPLGAMLSGGLDSSLIVALMARNLSGPVKTFSVGFSESGDQNELADARMVAEHYGADHHELELSLVRQDVELSELAWHLDEPLADLSSLGFLALSKLAAASVTVALSGQGADELLGGYSRHRNAALAARLSRLPAAIRTPLRAAASLVPRRLDKAFGVLIAADPVARYLVANTKVEDLERRRLVTGALAGWDGMGARTAVAGRMKGAAGDPLAMMLFLDAQLGLVDDMLHYFDRASMARSLEVRVPFLDHRIVEFCARVPTDLKVRGTTTKYLLKRAARGVVPDRIVDKRKIGFFNAAIGAWLRAQADGAVADYLLAPDPAYAELLDRAEVARLVAEYRSGAHAGGEHTLLSILMLEIWLKDTLPRALALGTGARDRMVAAS
jgi:asparagine synthase (glutamine-hydrolysing)